MYTYVYEVSNGPPAETTRLRGVCPHRVAEREAYHDHAGALLTRSGLLVFPKASKSGRELSNLMLLGGSF